MKKRNLLWLSALMLSALLVFVCVCASACTGTPDDGADTSTASGDTGSVTEEETTADESSADTSESTSEETSSEETSAETSEEETTTVTEDTKPLDPTETVQVTFDCNDDSCENIVVTVPVGQPVERVEDPFVEGRWFDGWYTVGGELYDFSLSVTEPLTLTARWAVGYRITFANGGVEAGMPESVYIKRNEEYALPEIGTVPDGFLFDGWSDGAITYRPGETYGKIKSNVTFTAMWRGTYSYSYDLGEGVSGSIEGGECTSGESFTVKGMPYTNGDYIFSGWTDGRKTYYEGDVYRMGNTPVVLHALWVEGVRVHFNNNLYSFNSDLMNTYNHVVATVGYEQGSLLTLPDFSNTPDMQKEGHIFLGWYREPECLNPWETDTDKVTEEITLYAKWRHCYFGFEWADAEHSALLIGRYDNYTNVSGTDLLDESGTLVLPDSYEGITIIGTINGTHDRAAFSKTVGSAFDSSYVSFKRVFIPKTYRLIGDYSFYRDKELVEVIFEDGECNIERIGDYAFYRCSAMKDMTFSKDLTYIGTYAFWCCEVLTQADFSACSKLERIGDYAFKSSWRISTLKFPENGVLRYIGMCAFGNCEGLTEVTVPASVTYLGAYAFSAATPAGGTTGDRLSWSTVSDVTALYICITPHNITTYYSDEDGIPIDLNDLSEEEVAAIKAFYEKEYGGYQLVSGNDAYRYVVMKLRRLTLECKLESIPEGLVAYCVKLEELTMAGNSEYRTIGKYAFYNCTKLTTVTIPASCNLIDDYAFYQCTNLKTVNFLTNESGKSNLTTIGGSAFCRSGVERIELPEGVQVVKWNAFQYAKQLQYISFPSTLTTMGSSILFYATSLTEIYFHPDCTITAFSSMMANGCTNLLRVNVPKNVRHIGGLDGVELSFKGCPSLMLTVCEGNPYLKEDPVMKGVIYSRYISDEELADGYIILEWVSAGYGKQLFETEGRTEKVTLVIPEGITTLRNEAMIYHPYIEELYFPASLRHFGTRSCCEMPALEKVVFAHSYGGDQETGITDMKFDGSCFQSNPNLKTFVLDVMLVPTDMVLFTNYKDTVPPFIYVPDEVIGTYRSTWSRYADFFRPLSQYTGN